MRSFKNHLSVMLPLFALLFSFQFSVMFERMTIDYERTIAGEYSIVVASRSDLQEQLSNISGIGFVLNLEVGDTLKRFEKELDPASFEILKNSLPKFYSVKLTSIPDQQRLSIIKDAISKIPGIVRVETFSASADKFYNFLQIFKQVSFVFSAFIVFMGVLLVFKQMELWKLEHKERMYIMGLFGSSFFMRSAILYRLVIVDSIICVFGVLVTYIYAPQIPEVRGFFSSLQLSIPSFNIIDDTLALLWISLAITIVAVTIVVLKNEKE